MSDASLIERLRMKAAGEKNAVGDYWGDWICNEAADTLERQAKAIAEARDALETMMDAWFDYHDSHSLTQPVTGRAGNAFDKALAAREQIDALNSLDEQP